MNLGFEYFQIHKVPGEDQVMFIPAKDAKKLFETYYLRVYEDDKKYCQNITNNNTMLNKYYLGITKKNGKFSHVTPNIVIDNIDYEYGDNKTAIENANNETAKILKEKKENTK